MNQKEINELRRRFRPEKVPSAVFMDAMSTAVKRSFPIWTNPWA